MTKSSPDTVDDPLAEARAGMKMRLEARTKHGTKWVPVYPAQVESFSENGAIIRAFEVGDSVAQTPPIVSMISDDELAELVDVHLALDRLSAPRQSEGFDLSAARRVNLLVHEMEKAAAQPPDEPQTYVAQGDGKSP